MTSQHCTPHWAVQLSKNMYCRKCFRAECCKQRFLHMQLLTQTEIVYISCCCLFRQVLPNLFCRQCEEIHELQGNIQNNTYWLRNQIWNWGNSEKGMWAKDDYLQCTTLCKQTIMHVRAVQCTVECEMWSNVCFVTYMYVLPYHGQWQCM